MHRGNCPERRKAGLILAIDTKILDDMMNCGEYKKQRIKNLPYVELAQYCENILKRVVLMYIPKKHNFWKKSEAILKKSIKMLHIKTTIMN